jgi:hypothetical protein
VVIIVHLNLWCHLLGSSITTRIIYEGMCVVVYMSGADPGLGGGAHLKKLRRTEGGAKTFGVFRVRNYDFTPKKSYFFQF